ncbi:MAG: MIP/aquaporin family protein [Caulobacterales bacterium]
MLKRALFAETLGSLLLTGVVIGSGILGSGLSPHNGAVALIGNTAATAAILYVLITIFGPISGAHFNPAVTLIFALNKEIRWPAACAYGAAQVIGCIGGAMLAHAMFEAPLLQVSAQDRSGLAKTLAEAVATFALVLTILGTRSAKPGATPAAVALVITAGYWWTSSTSFANPAITIARALTDSFAGIRPVDAPGFIASQLAGALAALTTSKFLFPYKRHGEAT